MQSPKSYPWSLFIEIGNYLFCQIIEIVSINAVHKNNTDVTKNIKFKLSKLLFEFIP